ncbi:hypothetical protein JDV02_004995 [Purpureocillium takamizusanense]|uniref:Uncharacterized protein n=1 Tax=Purpureocillium takamizusanense TaxID=2060973 RepID=A0A9Q8VBC0_9HYPO|nr:uncharacterized protein JDV02_004995 [Purpureocillium takamizusanense]UNI18739.1 hypothetical protein JDV02_004995 [Purpureocillium takamizusanense]
MASGTFAGPSTGASTTDPKRALLLLAPLASSTASLVFGWDQQLFLSLLARSTHGEATLPGYWRALFPRGVARVLALLAVTAGASAGAALAHGGMLARRGALGWYVAAGALALGHLGFVPAVAGRIRELVERDGEEGTSSSTGRSARAAAVADLGSGDDVDADKKGEAGRSSGSGKSPKSNVELQREWLRINLARTLTTDLGAWVCAFVAAVKTFS